MWRVNPAVAHAATQGMWDELFSEARRLGLMVDATAAFSMAELATVLSSPNDVELQEVQSSLSTRLSHLLPKPVQYLIIQSDHTIMAPGLLSPSDAARLRSIAVQESSGMASVWRVTTEAILRAYTDGATREELESFLAAMTPGYAVPQSLQYTIADAERLYQNAAANPAPLFHKTPHYVVTTITNPESNEEEDFFGMGNGKPSSVQWKTNASSWPKKWRARRRRNQKKAIQRQRCASCPRSSKHCAAPCGWGTPSWCVMWSQMGSRRSAPSKL